MWTFIGGLIGAIGTIIGFIVIALVLILCIWSLILDRGGSIDGSDNDDGGGYGSNGGIL